MYVIAEGSYKSPFKTVNYNLNYSKLNYYHGNGLHIHGTVLRNKLQLSISHEITRITTVTFMKPYIGVCIISHNL